MDMGCGQGVLFNDNGKPITYEQAMNGKIEENGSINENGVAHAKSD